MLVFRTKALIEIDVEEIVTNIVKDENNDMTSEEIQNVEASLRENTIQDENGTNFGTMVFDVMATDFVSAVSESLDYLEKTEKEFEILGVKMLKAKSDDLNKKTPISIVNVNCDCPFCRADRCSPDELLTFDCPECNKQIKVADGWETISCDNPKCRTEIKREQIRVSSDGKYYVDKKIKKSNKNNK